MEFISSYSKGDYTKNKLHSDGFTRMALSRSMTIEAMAEAHSNAVVARHQELCIEG